MVMKVNCPKCDHVIELVRKDENDHKFEWVKTHFDKLAKIDPVMEPCLKRCKEILDKAKGD